MRRGREEESKEPGTRERRRRRRRKVASFLSRFLLPRAGDFPPRGSSATLKPAALIFCSLSLCRPFLSSRFFRCVVSFSLSSRRPLAFSFCCTPFFFCGRIPFCAHRPSATDLAPSCNPWSSAFYLPAASFIPSRERLLSSNLPSILPVCSPAVVSVYVCSRAFALASLIISLMYFFSGFFRLSPSILRSLRRKGDLSRRSVNVANMRAG